MLKPPTIDRQQLLKILMMEKSKANDVGDFIDVALRAFAENDLAAMQNAQPYPTKELKRKLTAIKNATRRLGVALGKLRDLDEHFADNFELNATGRKSSPSAMVTRLLEVVEHSIDHNRLPDQRPINQPRRALVNETATIVDRAGIPLYLSDQSVYAQVVELVLGSAFSSPVSKQNSRSTVIDGPDKGSLFGDLARGREHVNRWRAAKAKAATGMTVPT